MKFTREGGSIELRVDVTHTPLAALPPGVAAASPSAAWLQIQVIDTGIGVEPDKLQRIFMPFVQAEESTVREFGGTGLGLTVRSGACRQHLTHACIRPSLAVALFLVAAHADLSTHSARDGRRADRQQRGPRPWHDVHVHHSAAAVGSS